MTAHCYVNCASLERCFIKETSKFQIFRHTCEIASALSPCYTVSRYLKFASSLLPNLEGGGSERSPGDHFDRRALFSRSESRTIDGNRAKSPGSVNISSSRSFRDDLPRACRTSSEGNALPGRYVNAFSTSGRTKLCISWSGSHRRRATLFSSSAEAWVVMVVVVCAYLSFYLTRSFALSWFLFSAKCRPLFSARALRAKDNRRSERKRRREKGV